MPIRKVSKEKAERFLMLRRSGLTLAEICKQENVSYATVAKHIKIITEKEKNGEIQKIKSEQIGNDNTIIENMYRCRRSIHDIATTLGSTEEYVKSKLSDMRKLDVELENSYNSPYYKYTGPEITLDKLYNFRDEKLQVGDIYKIKRSCLNLTDHYETIEVRVIKKYPFIASTDKGYFQYFDLYVGTKCN